DQRMRIANGDGSGSKEQWYPPGKAEQHRAAIALDVAVHIDGIEGCTEYCAWQKQPDYYPSRIFHRARVNLQLWSTKLVKVAKRFQQFVNRGQAGLVLDYPLLIEGT